MEVRAGLSEQESRGLSGIPFRASSSTVRASPQPLSSIPGRVHFCLPACFWVRVWLHSSGWPRGHHSPASASQIPPPCWSPTPRSRHAYFSSASKGLRHLAVPPSIAGGDEVSHATALQEGGRGHRATAEEFGKGDHLHEPQPDHCRLGVVTKAEPVTEASPDGHYIL